MNQDNVKCVNCSRLMNEEMARMKHNAKIDFWGFGFISLLIGIAMGIITAIGVMK